MLNEAAQKLVARAARADIQDYRDRHKLGANVDQLCAEAWENACTHNPEFRGWTSAPSYFEAIFSREIEAH